MKTKIVYIVTLRDGGLRFFEMFQLSVESLRLHQPDARIELVMDNVSYASLCETGQAVPKGVKLINVDVPQEWERQKYRYLKTKLRTLTGGDYLYLDVDTLISDIWKSLIIRTRIWPQSLTETGLQDYGMKVRLNCASEQGFPLRWGNPISIQELCS